MQLSTIILLVGCVYVQIIRKDYSESLRNKIAVVSLAYLPISLTLLHFYALLPIIVMLNKLLILFNCLCVILLLSLLKLRIFRSPLYRSIGIFWLYMLACSFMSNDWLPILSGKLSACLVFFSGAALGQQILLRGNLNQSFKILTIAAIFVLGVIYFFLLDTLIKNIYIENLGWARLGNREIINPNTLAMVILPYALIGITTIYLPRLTNIDESNLFWQAGGVGIVLVSAWLIVRTGSRSAFMSLCGSILVCLFLYARFWKLRMALALILLLIFAWFATNEYTGLRVLDFSGQGEQSLFYGRLVEWQEGISSMSALEKIFGSGGIVRNNFGELVWGGYLSIYVTIYHTAGSIGLALFAIFIFFVIQLIFRKGIKAILGASFITMALLFGVGEASPIMPFNIQCFFFGFGLGLLPIRLKPHYNRRFK
jgi:hypothetical protein